MNDAVVKTGVKQFKLGDGLPYPAVTGRALGIESGLIAKAEFLRRRRRRRFPVDSFVILRTVIIVNCKTLDECVVVE